VTKDLLWSKSGKGTYLDTDKTKTEKREQEKTKENDIFVGTVVVAVSTYK
jgi:hypothetical protein